MGPGADSVSNPYELAESLDATVISITRPTYLRSDPGLSGLTDRRDPFLEWRDSASLVFSLLSESFAPSGPKWTFLDSSAGMMILALDAVKV